MEYTEDGNLSTVSHEVLWILYETSIKKPVNLNCEGASDLDVVLCMNVTFWAKQLIE